MSLRNTFRKLVDPDVATLVEAGFLTEDLKITTDCRYYMEHLDFMNKKADLVARAKEILSERKEEK